MVAYMYMYVYILPTTGYILYGIGEPFRDHWNTILVLRAADNCILYSRNSKEAIV